MSYKNELYRNEIAEVIRVIDGDTIVARIDVGFSIETTHTLRLLGIDAPEIKGVTRPFGVAASNYLVDLLREASHETLGAGIYIRTQKDKQTDSFGRYLADIEDGHGNNICRAMVEAGHAVEYRKK